MYKLFKILIVISILFSFAYVGFASYLDSYTATDYYTLSRTFKTVDEFVELVKQDEINQSETFFDVKEDEDRAEVTISNLNANSSVIWRQKRSIILEKIAGEWAVTFSGIKYKCHQGHDIGGSLFYISSWERFQCK